MGRIIKQVINRRGKTNDGMTMTHRLTMVKDHFDMMVEEGIHFYGDIEFSKCKNIQDVLSLWGAKEVERCYQMIQSSFEEKAIDTWL